MGATVPVIIDTDIGDDIDDALALALAVRSPEIELIGVTTVYQCAELRARLVEHLLAAYGRHDVPVLAGVDRPLLGTVTPGWRPNQAGVLHPSQLERPVARGAVEFLVEQGRSRPGLVVVTIGPLTNAALAVAVEPQLAGRVRWVAMAGAWDRQGPEYNVACDPEALAVLLATGARPEFVGLDVTTKVPMRPEDLGALLSGAGAEAVLADFVRAWQAAGGGGPARCPVLHDPLAVAAVFRPELMEWRDASVAVELASPLTRGQTCTAGGPPNARVAHRVQTSFPAWFGERVCGASRAGVP